MISDSVNLEKLRNMVVRFVALVTLWTVLLAPPLRADSLSFAVSDQQGQPLAGVVLEVTGVRRAAPVSGAFVDQVDKRFVPEVLVVGEGSEVAFPNSDNIRHHVYSFSRAKSFELKLYADEPPAPVLFDKPGVVVLGCNIHDSMVGYIYVASSSLRAITDAEGTATIAGLPERVGQLSLWHPRMAEPAQPLAVRRDFDTGARGTVALTLAVTEPEPRNTFEDVFRRAD